MKFIKKLSLNKHQILITINSDYIINKNGLIFFGKPIYDSLDKINLKNIDRMIHQISGVFVCIIIQDEKLYIYNDICGNFRLYYRLEKNKLYLNDDYTKLLFNKKLQLDKQEFNFWIKKNYTTGSKTLFQQIKKIPPSTKTFFSGKKIKHSIYFNSDNKSGSISLEKNLKNNLIKNIIHLKNKKNILLFSGGKDSSLIAQLLLENKIKFHSVYINTKQKIDQIENNKTKASIIAKKNNFKLHEVKVDLKTYNINNILNSMLFDFHFSILHFEGIRLIKKKFGENINLICGQSADSIFSYGATSNSLSHFLSRFSYFNNNFLISLISRKILEKKYKTRLLYFKIKKNILFFLSFYYYLLVEKDLFKKSGNIIRSINIIKKNLKNNKDYFMYLKIFGFLQGPDNQVVINACKKSGVNYYLPYLDPQIIYNVINNKNNFKDIFFPKYAISNLLNSNFKIQKFHKKKYSKLTNEIKNTERHLKDLFIKKINQLTFK